MEESSVVVVPIDPALSFKANAEVVLLKMKAVGDLSQYRYLHEVAESGFNEIWIPTQDVFRREGLGRPYQENMKLHLIYEWWSQLLSDLFGERVKVERVNHD